MDYGPASTGKDPPFTGSGAGFSLLALAIAEDSHTVTSFSGSRGAGKVGNFLKEQSGILLSGPRICEGAGLRREPSLSEEPRSFHSSGAAELPTWGSCT